MSVSVDRTDLWPWYKEILATGHSRDYSASQTARVQSYTGDDSQRC